MIEWLLSVKPTINIFALNHQGFKLACKYYNLNVAKFLVFLAPEVYKITEITHEQIKYKIIKQLQIVEEKVVTSVEECIICRENECDIITFCNHSYCSSCIISWLDTNNLSCPTCRRNISYSFKKIVVNV
jgi:hypothetical protein